MDTELIKDGIEQAKCAVDSLKAVPFNAVFASDLSQAAKVRLNVNPGYTLNRTSLSTTMWSDQSGKIRVSTYS